MYYGIEFHYFVLWNGHLLTCTKEWTLTGLYYGMASFLSVCLLNHSSSYITVRMAPVILLVVAVGALAQCGLSDPLALLGNYTDTFVGFTIKQRIAFRIGQVECLKTLLGEGEYRNAQYGLGSLHCGNYNRDITRIDLKQHIAFLLGQVQCLKIHTSLEGNNERGTMSPVKGIF